MKTLHPKVFGGILSRRSEEQDMAHMEEYQIPYMDLVIVDLYPFEETLKQTSEESLIIEKIDIGGPSMIRAAAKNHKDVAVIASRDQYASFLEILNNKEGKTDILLRRNLASKAFETVAHYDIAIAHYFHNHNSSEFFTTSSPKTGLRYGENPHQQAAFYGNISSLFDQLNGKELSYNNLVDIDAACGLLAEFSEPTFAVLKHTNVCGIASAASVKEAWEKALQGDPESAFGGVLITNTEVDPGTAEKINELFFEILIAPGFADAALQKLKSKKNRILLQQKNNFQVAISYKNILNGTLTQQTDKGNYLDWKEAGGIHATEEQKADLIFANLVCKHLKSNAIALVKNKQLVGKGCGQTSRIDALKQSIVKASNSGFDLNGAVLASDAFFPFDDCVTLAHQAGIAAFIQPGGSVRDQDSIDYCVANQLPMIMTGMRHFKH